MKPDEARKKKAAPTLLKTRNWGGIFIGEHTEQTAGGKEKGKEKQKAAVLPEIG